MLCLAHGKYVIFFNWSEDGQFKCQRYGQNWRDLTGDSMILALCQELVSAPRGQTIDNQLKEMFEAYMAEAIEEQPDQVDHGFLCQLAAERAIEVLSDRVQRLADNRKYSHIEEVNKAFFGG